MSFAGVSPELASPIWGNFANGIGLHEGVSEGSDPQNASEVADNSGVVAEGEELYSNVLSQDFALLRAVSKLHRRAGQAEAGSIMRR